MTWSGWNVAALQSALLVPWIPPGGQTSPHSLHPAADPGGAQREPLHRPHGGRREVSQRSQTFLAQEHGTGGRGREDFTLGPFSRPLLGV